MSRKPVSCAAMNRAHSLSTAVVIGGGVIGLFTAWRLSDAGFKVTLIERGKMAAAATGAASWAAGGMLSPLPPDRIPEGIQSLLAESLALYPAWCAQLRQESGVDPEYWVCGAEYWKRDGQCLSYPEMAQVRSPRLLKALVIALRRRGVEMLENAQALGFIEADAKLRAIRTDRGDLNCTAAVLAAGAWSAALGADGIRPVKGQMLLARAAPGRLPCMLIGEEVYLIPRQDGHILVGSTLEHAGFDHTATAHAHTLLLARAEALWPAITSLPITRQWAGLRPHGNTPAPTIGPHPQVAGVWLATGHFRLGMTLAPATAERVVRQVESGACLIAAEPEPVPKMR